MSPRRETGRRRAFDEAELSGKTLEDSSCGQLIMAIQRQGGVSSCFETPPWFLFHGSWPWLQLAAAPQKHAKTIPGSGKAEAIKIHHLVPCRHEVLHELLLRVR